MMDLVVIYGPPATGKLTVARELAKLTGFEVFDNHATIDDALKHHQFGSEKFNEMVINARIKRIDDAARSGGSIIFTSIWKNANYESAEELRRMVERHGGRISFVYLTASKDELLKRVAEKSRKMYGKIKEGEQLSEYLDSHPISSEPPIPGSYHLDNTKTDPEKAAEMIMEHFHLKHTSEGTN